MTSSPEPPVIVSAPPRPSIVIPSSPPTSVSADSVPVKVLDVSFSSAYDVSPEESSSSYNDGSSK